MTIPDFDEFGFLPITLGGKREKDNSPYVAMIGEVVERLGKNQERRALLVNLLRYRKELYQLGFLIGTHFVGGSFVEDCERVRGRPPQDLDIITHLSTSPEVMARPGIAEKLESLRSRASTQYKVTGDIYADGLRRSGDLVHGLVWRTVFLSTTLREPYYKGILSIPLTPYADQEAWKTLVPAE